MNRKEAEQLCEAMERLTDDQLEVLVKNRIIKGYVFENWKAGNIQAYAGGADFKIAGEILSEAHFYGDPKSYKIITEEWLK